MSRCLALLVALSLTVIACSNEQEGEELRPASIEIDSGSFDWVSGCDTYHFGTVAIDLTADTAPVSEVTLQQVHFKGWYSLASADFRLDAESAALLPLAIGETVTMKFQWDGDGGPGECAALELPGSVALYVEVAVDGIVYQAENDSGVVSCGSDEPPAGGC